MVGCFACTTLPTIHHKEYSYPGEKAFVGKVDRPYKAMGKVRAKVNFQSLDPNREETDLCINYYNKAVIDLLEMAKDRGADAVVDVKSVVFFEDGRFELFSTPECADDGIEGQVLTQGIAVKWVN